MLILLFVGVFTGPAFSDISDNNSDQTRVHVIDVGYGDAIWLQFPGNMNVMIDAGPARAAETVIAYLRERGVTAFTWGIITHPHEDHYGGLAALMEEFEFKTIAVNGAEGDEGYQELLAELTRREIPTDTWRKGRKIDFRDGSLEVLSPESLTSSTNDDAIALLLEADGWSMLFPSDIGPARQGQILDDYPEVKRASWVMLPHHGGPFHPGFIEELADADFVMSVGDNPWGQPIEEDIAQLRGRMYRTDQHGTVVIGMNGIGISKH